MPHESSRRSPFPCPLPEEQLYDPPTYLLEKQLDVSDSAIRVHCVIDEPDIRSQIVRVLQDYGMYVTFSDESGLARRLRQNDLDLIVLDLRRSSGKNADLLRRILSLSIPVIVTDDPRSVANDGVMALELGADDYMAEPIAPRELVARVNTVLRRRGRARQDRPLYSEGAAYRFGGLTLNLLTRKLTKTDGTVIMLAVREYALLLEFLDKPGRILTREQLKRVIPPHRDSFDRSVDVVVLRLRRKLQECLRGRRVIETKRGIGYVFTVAVERLSPPTIGLRTDD